MMDLNCFLTALFFHHSGLGVTTRTKEVFCGQIFFFMLALEVFDLKKQEAPLVFSQMTKLMKGSSKPNCSTGLDVGARVCVAWRRLSIRRRSFKPFFLAPAGPPPSRAAVRS